MNKCFNVFRKFIEWNSKLVFAGTTLILIFIYIMFVGLTMQHFVMNISSLPASHYTLLFCSYTVIFWGTLWIISLPSIKKAKWYYFWSISLLVVITISITSISLIDNVNKIDFGLNLYNARLALKMNSFKQIIDNIYRIHFQRSLFFLYPVLKIFGDDIIYIKCANILYHIFIGLNIYYFAKSITQKEQIARIAMVLYFLIPNTYLCLNLTSHDFPGMLLILLIVNLSLLVIRKIIFLKRISYKFLWYLCPAILLGILWFLLNQIRIQAEFVGPIFGAWFLGYGILTLLRHPTKRCINKFSLILVTIVIIPILCFQPLKYFFKANKEVDFSDKSAWVLWVNAPDGLAKDIDRFEYLMIPLENRGEFAYNVMSSFITKDKSNYARQKVSGKFHRMGAYNYGKPSVDYGLDQKKLTTLIYKEITSPIRPIIRRFLQIFISLFVILGLLNIYKNGTWRSPLFLGILFTTIFILFSVFIGEVHSRYMCLVHGFIFTYAGIGINFLSSTNKNNEKLRVNNRCMFFQLGLVIFVTVCLFQYFFRQSITSNPYSLHDLRKTTLIKNNGIKSEKLKPPKSYCFAFDFKKIIQGNEKYTASWPLENLVSGREYNFNGFFRVLEKSSQIVEVIINDKVIFSSATERKQFAKSKKNGKYLITFMHDLKFTAKEKNTLTLKFSNPGKGKVTYDASLLGVYVSPLTEKEYKGNRNK